MELCLFRTLKRRNQVTIKLLHLIVGETRKKFIICCSLIF